MCGNDDWLCRCTGVEEAAGHVEQVRGEGKGGEGEGKGKGR